MPDNSVVSFAENTPKDKIKDYILSNFPEVGKGSELTPVAGNTGARRFAQQPLQGATLGFSDEITGALGGVGAKVYDEARALFGKERLFENESAQDLINAGIDTARQDVKAQLKKRPIESLALQGAGGVVGGAAGAGTRAGKALGANLGSSRGLAKVPKVLGVGSGFGAVAGFGAGEGSVEERLPDAAEGAFLGGILAGAFPLAGSISRFGKNVTIGRQPEKLVLDSLEGGATGENLASMRSQLADKESPLSVVDLGKAKTQGLLRAVAKMDDAQNYVEDFLVNRSESASKRISSLLSQKVSSVDSYFQNLDDLAKARKQVSNVNYKEAIDKGKNLKKTKRLNTLLNDERINYAVNEAKKKYGVSLEAKRNSVETLNGVNKVLEDLASSAARQGQGNLAGTYRQLKNELLKEVDAQVPEYKKARNVFAGFKELENAQELGMKFEKMDPEEITKLRKRMTAGEHDAFLIGVRKSLQNSISKVADTGDTAGKIFRNELIRDKIKATFPSEQSYNEFAKRMTQEMKAAETFQKVLRGSRTDFNIAEDSKAIVEFGKRVREGGVTSAAVDALAVAMRNRAAGINDSNARKVAEIMLDKQKGLEALDRLIAGQNSLQAQALEAVRPLIKAKEVGLVTPATTLFQGEK